MTTSDPIALISTDALAHDTQSEQIRLLYRNAPAGITVNILSALVVTMVLWHHAPVSLLTSWALAVVLVALLRVLLVQRYRRSINSNTDLSQWAVLFSIGAACAGGLWGAIGLVSPHYLDLTYQLFVAFAVGGLAMGALAMSGVFMPAYLAFMLPSLLPLSYGFFAQDNSTHVAMSLLTLVYAAALYLMGRNANKSIVQSIRLTKERTTLIDTLRNAYENARTSNQKLADEIGERRRVEAELRNKAALYRGMFERNKAVKLLIDPTSGVIVDANPAASDYYGYPLSTLKGEKIQNINILPSDRVLERMAWATTGRRERFEFEHRLASGEIRDVEVYSGPIQFHGRQLLFSIIHDITDRKRAERSLQKMHDQLERRVQERTAELAASNARLHQEIEDRKQAEHALLEEKERAQVTLHSIGDAVITTDAKGIVEYINPVAEAMTDWPLTEACGRSLDTIFRIIDEQSGEDIQNLAARCLREGRTIGLTENATLISRSWQKHAIRASAAPIRDWEGVAFGVVVAFSDISETRQLAELLAHQATHDALTDLVNRREFERRVAHALVGARRFGTQHALCYLDLDQFKLVNDTAGHVAGDTLLRQIANLLMQKIRSRDTLARLGGDEFGLLLDNCPLDNAFDIAKSLVGTVRDYRFLWKERTFQIGVSIGVAPISVDSEDTGQLLSQADVACYTAKDQGRNRVHVYQLKDSEPARRHTEILRAAELRDALEKDRLRIYCQPIVPLALEHRTATHYELLLRLQDTEGKIVLPGSFIPPAERYGLIGAIDRWVVRTAFNQLGNGSGALPSTLITINLSGHSLSSAEFLEFVMHQFDDTNVAAEKICFEVTETAVIHNFNQAMRFITNMKERGCYFALDDFGSGVSSFSYLKRLPVDYLKIDGSFVQNILTDSADLAIVAAITQVGRTMGTKTIAECAETDAIVNQLEQLGVDYAQGYALGYPLPIELH